MGLIEVWCEVSAEVVFRVASSLIQWMGRGVLLQCFTSKIQHDLNLQSPAKQML
jgi:hypothetical protein